MCFELGNHKSLPQNTVYMFIGLNQMRFHLGNEQFFNLKKYSFPKDKNCVAR